MKKEEFIRFFEPYSENVDNANRQYFWKLSDTLIEGIIKQHIDVKTISMDSVIMDAGGGTGRWIERLSTSYEGRFVLYDLSEDMLKKARERVAQSDTLTSRVKIVHGDLQDMSLINDETIDHIVSIYSPISFVEKPAVAFEQMYRKLKPGGKLMIMGHGYYNAIASKMNNYQASPKELSNLVSTQDVKWAEHVPLLHTFSVESMNKLMLRAGFKPLAVHGVPVFVQPGSEDFDPTNSAVSPISKALGDQNFFDEVVDTEMKFNAVETAANRGVNMFAVGQK